MKTKLSTLSISEIKDNFGNSSDTHTIIKHTGSDECLYSFSTMGMVNLSALHGIDVYKVMIHNLLSTIKESTWITNISPVYGDILTNYESYFYDDITPENFRNYAELSLDGVEIKNGVDTGVSYLYSSLVHLVDGNLKESKKLLGNFLLQMSKYVSITLGVKTCTYIDDTNESESFKIRYTKHKFQVFKDEFKIKMINYLLDSD